ncbi:unnamed protein product [Polarella glacialis]|uniref:Uncharacterized protein n=1 Tax=Polarella glacialis TaxID=89957 RepID=A0A813ED50_POLGL|nr:unnamed protein product [Polarella glacialis]
MALADALEGLGAAIQTEVQREVGLLRQELEQERQLRQLLEQQVLKLQAGVYTSSEVDSLADGLQKRMDADIFAALDAASKDWIRNLRESQYHSQAALEELRASFTSDSHAPNEASSKRHERASAETPLLTLEMDRKLGTVLLDLDQRFAEAHAEQGRAKEAALHRMEELIEASRQEVLTKIDEVAIASAAGQEQVKLGAAALGFLEQASVARVEALQTSLEQKIGMVQLDIDQLRNETFSKG